MEYFDWGVVMRIEVYNFPLSIFELRDKWNIPGIERTGLKILSGISARSL
jgi:hypothetical protein